MLYIKTVNNMKKDFPINIRVPKELFEEIKKDAIKKSFEKNEFISVSGIIREMIEKKYMKNEK